MTDKDRWHDARYRNRRLASYRFRYATNTKFRQKILKRMRANYWRDPERERERSRRYKAMKRRESGAKGY
jgi:hypothetical protein